MKKIFLISTLVLVLTVSAYAFDGERQGFVAGVGLGFAPTADWKLDGFSSIGESSSGLAVSAFAGYGYDDHFLIVLQRDGVINNNKLIDNSSEKIFQGFTGIVLYYYFGDAGSSFFMLSGVGLQDFNLLDNNSTNYKSDIGYQIGAGYEFREHLQLSANFSYGKTKTTFKFEHQQVMFLLTFLIY